jgi:hypothetical protein
MAPRNMTMAKLDLDIPDDLQTRLQYEADREGVTVHTLATRRLLEPAPAVASGSLLDYLGDFVGSISDSNLSSQDAGAQFAVGMAKKHRERNL